MWIRERTHGNAHGLRIAVFRMKQRGPAHGTEPEDESRTLIADTRVLSRLTMDLVGRRKSGERGEDTAGATLAGKAIADADTSWLAIDFNSQLSAGACSGSRQCGGCGHGGSLC